MINIKEFSGLAYYVYRDMPNIIKHIPNLVYKRHQYRKLFFMNAIQKYNGIFEVILDDALQNPKYLKHNFYGSVFVKVFRHQPTSVVVGIRGTVPSLWGNDWVDIHSWWKSVFDDNASINLPIHFVHMAAKLCNQALRFARHELNLPSSRVFVTGHSLGGAIAGLIPTKVKLPIRAVTFNAPGIKEIPGVTDFPSRVINIRSKYDFVSAIAEPIGPVWNVSVPQEETAAADAFKISENKQQHPLELTLLDPAAIDNLVESADFLKSAMAQHSMLNLWQAMKHTNIESQTYASFEGMLEYLQRSYAMAVA